MSLVNAIAADLLAEWPKIEKATCLQCGCGVDPKRASGGGRGRFCSDRCLAYFDAGWDAHRAPGWLCAKTAFVDARNADKTARSVGQKQRRKVERKKALAESWKRYQEKAKAAASPVRQTEVAATTLAAA